MNDFIVWDKCRKVWIDESYPFFINSSGFLCIQRNDKQMVIENDCEIFKSLGLTDIRSKSIYADSSIVEFIFKDEPLYADFTGKKPTVWNEIKMIGYFTYDMEDLRCEIDIIDWEKDKTKSQFSCLHYNNTSMSNFKIIDTIQENKLGLIK